MTQPVSLNRFIEGYLEKSGGSDTRWLGLLDNQDYGFSTRDNVSVIRNYRLPGGALDYISAKNGDLWKALQSAALLKVDRDKDLMLFHAGEYEHNTDDPFIRLLGTDAHNFELSTGNVIGQVTYGKQSIRISSRFGDHFLRYIIADADGFLEVEESGTEGGANEYQWLLAYLWSIKLKRAYRLGLPKVYQSRHERTPKVRGVIDLVDYFQNRNTGKYLCSYREHSYDNPATSLFLKTYQLIEKYQFCAANRSIYNALLAANQGVRRSLREMLDTKHFTNPFYSDYNVLIDLSKQMLRQSGLSLDDQNESSAFLFDISMLFEYFIRKLLVRHGFNMREKFGDKLKIPAGVDSYQRELQPDLVWEHEGGLYVFDVKYKSFDFTYGVKREDLFQMHTYIGQYGNEGDVKGCGFIYPISASKWAAQGLEVKAGVITMHSLRQQNKQIPFHVLFFKVPEFEAKPDDDENRRVTDNKFKEDMERQCELIVNGIKEKVLLISEY